MEARSSNQLLIPQTCGVTLCVSLSLNEPQFLTFKKDVVCLNYYIKIV